MWDTARLSPLPLFAGIEARDIPAVLSCLGARERTYPKGGFLALDEGPSRCVGLLLRGAVHMVREDVWGRKTILTVMGEGELFGEAFACGQAPEAAAAFYTPTGCGVLLLPFQKVLHACSRACAFHQRLTENMVGILAARNMQLIEKVDVISKKSLREKLLAYFSQQARLCGGPYFELPLGRGELADYLCADRSALTRELAAMRAEGLIDFDKNTFRVLRGRP